MSAPRTDPVAWTSPNGIDWTPDADPSGHFRGILPSIVSTSSAIVVATCCGASGMSFLRTSSDGITWQDSAPPGAERTGSIRVAAAGETFLGVTTSDQRPVDGQTAPLGTRSTAGRTSSPDHTTTG